MDYNLNNNQPVNSQPTPEQNSKPSYSKKNLWKWVLLYILIGVIAYGAVYYFFFYKKAGYSYVPQNEQTQNSDFEKISEQDAVNLVRDLPEVQEWLRLFKVTNVPIKPIIEVDHKTDTAYVVHVYEWNNDHTATFNWYDVDMETGNIKKEF